ncbi:hypothetical protein [Clostridium grantii]|uniref:Methyltransferase domain-containing protein n=1 Tax=Clostridium grantii DSM 8605 TaxID=1121316 RepID=A0A1M5RGB6_9CLOT|nr:hypothetical protein [Clostridium grantii]SHH25294.1 hypothetical protein SAMN02745207_00515 [Clostridium grantii DSM 8605]
MKGDIIVNMENIRFNGDVLDIGYDNWGIIYNICRTSKETMDVKYIKESKSAHNEGKDNYNTCASFLTFGRMLSKKEKSKFIQRIYEYLDKDGFLYIWDIDKKRGETIDVSIKVILPYRKIKSLQHKDFNLLKQNNLNEIKELLNSKFEILYEKDSNGMFYIKAQKKG